MEGDAMTPEQRRTAREEEIRQAQARIGNRRGRVAWAVQFAQEALGQLSPGQLLDRRHDLKAFLGYGPAGGISYSEETTKLPADETMQAIQAEFARVIGGVLRKETVHFIRYTMAPSLIWFGNKLRFVQMPDHIEQSELDQAAYALAMLIDDLYREERVIKVCDAPKPRAKAEERCGRWFVGRPNQTYCSPSCRNLANTRATRAKPQQRARRRTPGTK
jgi:hypothetical protein